MDFNHPEYILATTMPSHCLRAPFFAGAYMNVFCSSSLT